MLTVSYECITLIQKLNGEKEHDIEMIPSDLHFPPFAINEADPEKSGSSLVQSKTSVRSRQKPAASATSLTEDGSRTDCD